MGTEAKKSLKIILDTNVLVSALLFRGELSVLVPMWKDGAFIPFSRKRHSQNLNQCLPIPNLNLPKTK